MPLLLCLHKSSKAWELRKHVAIPLFGRNRNTDNKYKKYEEEEREEEEESHHHHHQIILFLSLKIIPV